MKLILGKVTVTPENHDTCRHAAVVQVKNSREEPCGLDYHCYNDPENQETFVFVEHWQDKETVSAHFAMPYCAEFMRKVRQLAVESDISIFEATKENPGNF